MALSRGCSLYISDWRHWYPRDTIFRDEQDLTSFLEWNEDDPWDQAAQPLARFLRSEIEEKLLGLKAMLMIPIYEPGVEAGGPPRAVIQIASPEHLHAETRLRSLQTLAPC